MKTKFLSLIVCCCIPFIFVGCEQNSDNHFVDSAYIMAYPTKHKTEEENEETKNYAFDINYMSYAKLKSLHYKCELYLNYNVIETIESEIPEVDQTHPVIPIETTTKFDRVKITCTGYSNDNPKTFVRVNAMSFAEMKNCEHKNLINNAEIIYNNYDLENCYSIISFNTNSAYSIVSMFYDICDTSIGYKKVNFCLDCGFFEVKE